MKRAFILFAFILLLISSVSAEIIVLSQPNKIYNIGDTITIPVTVKATSDVSGTFNMDLLCSGKQINFYKNGVNLKSGEEKTMEASLVLAKSEIGELTGTCKIKGSIGADYVLLNEFRISNLIIVQPNTEQKEFEPGQSILIYGSAVKENGKDASGFIDMELTTENSSENILQTGTISNGFYSINITLPENLRAGNYLIKLNAYEIDFTGKQTNKGFSNYNIAIKQVPRSLEIAFETIQVEPGTNAKIKAILHDQTGDKIASTSIITIKKGTGTNAIIQKQSEKNTDEYLEYAILYNEPASNWTVFAISNQLTAEATFVVIEKEDIDVKIINETVIISNRGNVPYNKSIVIVIGENQTIDLNVSLGVDKIQEYTLRAPDGVYEVEIIDKDGKTKARETVMLTGRAIDIKENTGGIGKVIGIIVWIFVILVVGLAIFFFFKKGYKRIFIGRMRFKKKAKKLQVNTAWENRSVPLSRNSKLETKNKANLSLSIKGNKQEVSLVAISVKNLREIQSRKGNAEETLQKVVNFAEDKKAFIYENQESLFFILTPAKTRTFKNESIALEIAQKSKEMLLEHNRLFKQKISFGISLNCGMIIEKIENGVLEFMSIENLITNAKRIASIAKEDMLISEKMRNKLPGVRTEKEDNEKIAAYKIKEIKYHDEAHSRFIKSFLKRNDAERK